MMAGEGQNGMGLGGGLADGQGGGRAGRGRENDIGGDDGRGHNK